MWSDIGFGDYYSELAVWLLLSFLNELIDMQKIKIYRILISKRKTNGGLMKISDVIDLYNRRSKDPDDKISKWASNWIFVAKTNVYQ